MSYGTQYLDIPQLTKTAQSGGKDSKMSKNSTTNEAPKTSKKYAKTRGEHYKDIVIAVLVTGIIAFVAGTMFQGKQQNAINAAVNAVSPSVEAAPGK